MGPSINTPYPSPQVSPMCSNSNVILWQKKALRFPHKHLQTIFVSHTPHTISMIIFALSLVTPSATYLIQSTLFFLILAWYLLLYVT